MMGPQTRDRDRVKHGPHGRAAAAVRRDDPAAADDGHAAAANDGQARQDEEDEGQEEPIICQGNLKRSQLLVSRN